MPTKRTLKRAAKSAAKKGLKVGKQVARAGLNAAKSELGRSLRRGLTGAFATLSGMGDYKMNAIVSGAGSGTPSFGSSVTRIRRREYVSQVVSSATASTFSLTKYRLNPGDAATFPWLSHVAAVYESWIPRSIVLEFKSTSGTAVGSTNTALGVVILAPQYNPYIQDPDSRVQVNNFPHVLEVAPFQDGLCGVECNPKERGAHALLIRSPDATGPSDAVSLYDLADFMVCTDGCQGTSVVLGDLWVTYDIDLLNPRIPSVFPFNPSCYIVSAAGVNNTNQPFGTSRTITDSGFNVGTSASTIQINNAHIGTRLFVQWRISKAALTALPTITPVLTGLTQVDEGYYPQATHPGCADMIYQVLYDVTAARPSFNWTGSGVGATTLDNMKISITVVDPAVWVNA